MEKGKLQSGEGSSGYWDKFFFFIIIFLFFFFFLLYNSLPWNKMFQSRRSHDGLQGMPVSQKMAAAIQNPLPTFPWLSEVSTL
jgi:hypothetical protein